MGQFTETTLEFDFVGTTPDRVLAAFSSLPIRPGPSMPLPGPATGEPPDQDMWADEDPDYQPWTYDWGATVASGVVSYASTFGRGEMVWVPERFCWRLECHASWKTDPDSVLYQLSWLAPYMQTPDPARSHQVGQVVFELGRPYPVVLLGGRLEVEGADWRVPWR